MATVIKLRKGASIEEMEAIRRQLRIKDQKGFDAKKHSGVIQLTEDPLAFQKRIRDEWE